MTKRHKKGRVPIINFRKIVHNQYIGPMLCLFSNTFNNISLNRENALSAICHYLDDIKLNQTNYTVHLSMCVNQTHKFSYDGHLLYRYDQSKISLIWLFMNKILIFPQVPLLIICPVLVAILDFG